jgi:hypothetical protein
VGLEHVHRIQGAHFAANTKFLEESQAKKDELDRNLATTGALLQQTEPGGRNEDLTQICTARE